MSQTACRNSWYDPRMFRVLRKLNAAHINDLPEETYTLKEDAAGLDLVRPGLVRMETHATRLPGAMQLNAHRDRKTVAGQQGVRRWMN